MGQSLIDTMSQDIKTRVDTSDDAPMRPECAQTPPIGFSYDYMTDKPPVIQRVADAPMHSSPYHDLPKLLARAAPALLAPRQRASSVPPTPTTVSRMAKRYMPVTEEVTPPILPARVETASSTPSPVRHLGTNPPGSAAVFHPPVVRRHPRGYHRKSARRLFCPPSWLQEWSFLHRHPGCRNGLSSTPSAV